MPTLRRRVIIDLDAGADDAMALLVLLHAEKKGLVKVEAITCSRGNTSRDNVIRNVFRVLEILNRTDIPVYKGAKDAIIPHTSDLLRYHGEDGLGDLRHDYEPDVTLVQKTPASIAMHDIVTKNPGEITLVCVGPLTNLALSMRMFDNFVDNIKDIFLMGGNYAATGNVTEAAEFNFYVDPEAAYIVLEMARCPITIATWETCLNVDITFDWRFNVLGSKNTPFMNLLNRAERSIYFESDKPPCLNWYSCDPMCVIAMLYPQQSIIKQSKHNATVELYGRKTRGQIVLDHLKQKEPNVTVLEKLNDEFIKELFLEVAEYC